MEPYIFARIMYEEYRRLGSVRNEYGWPKCSWENLGTQERLIWADAAREALTVLHAAVTA